MLTNMIMYFFHILVVSLFRHSTTLGCAALQIRQRYSESVPKIFF